MQIDDYVVFRGKAIDQESSKEIDHTILGRVTRVSPLTVTTEPDYSGVGCPRRYVIKHPEEDVLCNLGKEPKAGYVFGIDTSNIYAGHNKFGKVFNTAFYYRPEDEALKSLDATFSELVKILDGERLSIPFLTKNVFFKVSHASCQGYCTRIKGTNEFIINLDLERMTSDVYMHVLLHEIGHFYFYQLPYELKVQWIKLFSEFVDLQRFSENDVCKMVKDFRASGLSFKEFKKEYSKDDPERDLFMLIVKSLKKVFRVKDAELEALYKECPDKVLAKVPDMISKPITIPVFEFSVSDYALENFQEFFAENFANFLLTKKVQVFDLQSCMQNSLSCLRKLTLTE